MKITAYSLNIVIIVMLICMTIYVFHIDSRNNSKINVLEESLKNSYNLIDSLHSANLGITNDVGILKDSIIRYKTSILFYNDSLVKIRNYYENISNDVYILNDSASYEYFKNYLITYSKGHSSHTN
jgi:hypothetical protein